MQLYGFIRFQDTVALYHADQEAWVLNFHTLAHSRHGKKYEAPRVDEDLQVLTQENAESWMEYFDDCMVDPDEVRQELTAADDDEKNQFLPRFYVDIALETFAILPGPKTAIDYEVCLPDGWRFEVLRNFNDLAEFIGDGMDYWHDVLEDGATFRSGVTRQDDDDEGDEEKDEFDDGFGEMDPDDMDEDEAAPTPAAKAPLADWLHDDGEDLALDDDEDKGEDSDEEEGLEADDAETAVAADLEDGETVPAAGGAGAKSPKAAKGDGKMTDRIKSILSAINFDDDDEDDEEGEEGEEDEEEDEKDAADEEAEDADDEEIAEKAPPPVKAGRGKSGRGAKVGSRGRRSSVDLDADETDEDEAADEEAEEDDFNLDDDEDADEEEDEDEEIGFGGGDDDEEEARPRRGRSPRGGGRGKTAAAEEPAGDSGKSGRGKIAATAAPTKGAGRKGRKK